jgi:hypothetical protein
MNRQDPMTGEANPRLSKVQELRDENIRLHTIINTYRGDLEQLRQENYRQHILIQKLLGSYVTSKGMETK